MIALFYLAKPRYGGWVTFTSHLFRSLKGINQNPKLFKITKTNEDKVRYFADNVFYQNINIQTAQGLLEQYPSLITAQDKNYINYTDILLKKNCKIVIHDPNEMKDVFINTIKKNNTNPIVIRKTNYYNLKDLGVKSQYFMHPYLIYNKAKPIKNKLAVATSRVDFDKHTEIIIEANKLLNNKVEIYGAENPIYTYHKLNKLDSNWKINYKGVFQNKLGSVYTILNPAKFMIDMSAIKKDGGGSQYTFLEGWDSCCIIILNKKWDLGQNSLMQQGKNCLFVKDAKELFNILQSESSFDGLIKQGLEDLKAFNGLKVVKDYIDVIKRT